MKPTNDTIAAAISKITASGFYGLEINQKVKGPEWFVWEACVTYFDGECWQQSSDGAFENESLGAVLDECLAFVTVAVAERKSKLASKDKRSRG